MLKKFINTGLLASLLLLMAFGETGCVKGRVKNAEFWQRLKKAYDIFELNHSLPKISVDKIR